MRFKDDWTPAQLAILNNGGWTVWPGGERPVPEDARVQVWCRFNEAPTYVTWLAGSWRWDHHDGNRGEHILAYRVMQPLDEAPAVSAGSVAKAMWNTPVVEVAEPLIRLLSPGEPARQFPHYHKACGFATVDVYRVLAMFEVGDPCLQHAIKKLLVAGQRGAKDAGKDISEAIATLQRWQEMRQEEAAAP